VMFGPAGYVYVYLIYGMYYCVNIVTDRAEFASAVLIRALQIDSVTPEMLKPREKADRVAAGPGKLCRAMQIDLTLYGTPLAQGQPLWLEHRAEDWSQGLHNGTIELIQTTRIGLTQGLDLPWRWLVQDCPSVSKPAVLPRS